MPIAPTDSLECILEHTAELRAAYTDAANSGCKKVKAGRWSVYECGWCNSVADGKCIAAEQKIKAILDGCRPKPPQHQPAPGPDDLAVDTPGCNSLGIWCDCDPT